MPAGARRYRPKNFDMSISAIILAGGRGARLGYQDKGLLHLGDRKLVEWVIEKIQPQVNEVVISANRNKDLYQTLGLPVISDILYPNFGPLAGILNALPAVQGPWVLTAPCDSPFLPLDLVARLKQALNNNNDIAVPLVGDRAQSAICLFNTSLHQNLKEFLASGHKKMEDWHSGLNRVLVPFENSEAFLNINEESAWLKAQAVLGT